MSHAAKRTESGLLAAVVAKAVGASALYFGLIMGALYGVGHAAGFTV